ncbi:hypothetical protein HTZ77_10070 [Nonomuraea sp. SMC257]|uniref:Phage tail protein n=1 Tax=Nonomuraea montanisoli TaxID=2741721 RepID=A0A7Y6M2R5_9ACTN|nr:hypothetical protein [Nonomuraea montanisoli]NUW31771.1 hypothetical protein [Nonomuraea montanisoli]
MGLSRFGIMGVGVVAALAGGVTARPALAETCPAATTCDTTVVFSVSTAQGLAISVPDGPVGIGTGAAGDQISGSLGSVTVSDERAALVATWVATVSGTSFTTGGGSGAETIPAGAISYWSGPATSTTGTGTFVPGQPNAASAKHLHAPYTAFSKISGSGDNSCTWNPTIVVDIPDGAVAGTYTGTISHSVA